MSCSNNCEGTAEENTWTHITGGTGGIITASTPHGISVTSAFDKWYTSIAETHNIQPIERKFHVWFFKFFDEGAVVRKKKMTISFGFSDRPERVIERIEAMCDETGSFAYKIDVQD